MVTEIKINGKSYPFRYDINALCEYEQLTGSSLMNGAMTFSFSFIRALLYVGMKSGHKYEDRKFKLTLESVGEIVGEVMKEDGELERIMGEVTTLLNKCLGIKERKEESHKEGDSPGE